MRSAASGSTRWIWRGVGPHGVRTTLAVLGPAPSEDQWADAARVPGVRLIRADFPLEWLALSGAVVEAAGYAVAALARESQADIVHLNTPALGAEGGFAQPVVAVAHASLAQVEGGGRGPSPTTSPGRRWCGALRPSARWLRPRRPSPTPPDVYDLAQAPVVGWNGRRVGSGLRRARDFRLHRRRLWDPGGVDVLDRAAARISSLVVAAGPLSGPHGQSVPLPNIRTLGRVDDAEVARRLALRPVFVSPSLYEPFGLAVLEAAQVGCALALSDIPTFRELWGGAAVFTPPGDEAALATRSSS